MEACHFDLWNKFLFFVEILSQSAEFDILPLSAFLDDGGLHKMKDSRYSNEWNNPTDEADGLDNIKYFPAYCLHFE